MKNILPAFWFPTKTLLIDDDGIYLENISFALREKINPKEFNSVFDALEEIKNSGLVKTEQTFDLAESANLDHPFLFFKEDALVKNIFDKKRFDRITTVICDYSMPEMNGVDFFKEIADLPIQKILLTGKADSTVAIEAFNAGFINLYVKKGPKAIADVLSQVPLLQRKIFIDASRFIHDVLHNGLFLDPVVIEKMNEIIEEHAIAEFYLLNNMGSYLLVKKDGSLLVLSLLADADIEEMIKGFDDYDAFDDKVLSAMKARQKIPFLLSEEEKKLSPSDWGKHLYPLTKLEGCQNYYFSLVEYPHSPFAEPIYSYQDYLKDS